MINNEFKRPVVYFTFVFLFVIYSSYEYNCDILFSNLSTLFSVIFPEILIMETLCKLIIQISAIKPISALNKKKHMIVNLQILWTMSVLMFVSWNENKITESTYNYCTLATHHVMPLRLLIFVLHKLETPFLQIFQCLILWSVY